MYYNFDQSINRRDSNCLKWDTYDEDVLPMWVADMDFVSPEPVLQALRGWVECGIFGYPADISANPKTGINLKNIIVDRLLDRYGWQIAPQDILFVPGVVTGFNLACHMLEAPRNAVMINTPVYPPIQNAARNTRRKYQGNEMVLSENGAYVVDFDRFRDSVTVETGLVILCNPQNPLGKVFNRDELEQIAEICLEKDILICSDEIHSDLVYSGHTHIPMASLDPRIAEKTITLMAPSKTFNLPGLQCSFAIIPDERLRKRYIKAKQGLVPWVNQMGLVAAEAAYRDGSEWFSQLIDYLERNRNFLVETLKKEIPSIRMVIPEGTYLAWLDCREANLPEDPYTFFLREARVAFNNGVDFGPGGEGHVRLNFGCPRHLLAEALRRIKSTLT